MEKRKIIKEDLLNFKFIEDPQISPDGTRVIFVVKDIVSEKNCYRNFLFLAEVESGAVRQFSFGDGNDTAPRWSPNGDRIAFLRVSEGCSQIWVIPADGGEASPLTQLDEGSFNPPVWSPVGDQIAFAYRPTHPDWTKKAREERKVSGFSNPPRILTKRKYRAEGQGFLDVEQHLWVCDLSTRKVRQITTGAWDDRDMAWSPTGGEIAFISHRGEDPDSKPYEQDIWLVSPQGGEPRRISTPSGYKWGLSWSPDGRQIAYIGSETVDDPWGTHNDRLWVVEPQTEIAVCLTESLDRIVEDATISDVRGSGDQKPVWSGDGKRIYFPISDQGGCHIYVTNLEGEIKPEIQGKLNISGITADLKGGKSAILTSKPTQMAEVFIAELPKDKTADESMRQLTHFNDPLFQGLMVSEPEEFWYRSSDDTQIQGWLLKPPDFDETHEYPLVLYIHGGPAAQYGYTFFHEYQVLAAQGNIVLYTNPRGSLGREEAFATCIQGDWGNLDYQDLMAAVDYAEKLPFVDSKRMAVVGGSYGGFMTTWIVGHTNRFRCGIAERGVSNRHSAVGTSDSAQMPDGYWKGNTWSQPETLWSQSPLRFADQIHTPLMIIHSEGDLRVPVGQAEQLFLALTALKREVVFVRYPIETKHGFSRNGPPDLRIDRLERITQWLADHLQEIK